MEVTTPLRDFPGVGDARAKSLERLGLRTAGDLTAYFPRGYEDRREQYTIAAAPLDVPVCIPVLLAEEPRRMNIRRGLDVTRMKVVDGASAMLVTFFNQGYVRQALHRGEEYILYGKVEQMGNHRQMTNPQFEPAARPRFTGCIMPVYPLTAGVSNNLLAGLVQRALEELPPAAESLPEDFRAAHGLAPAAECYRNIHFPDSFENLEAARRRFSFEELFYLSLGLALLRERRSRGEGPVFQAAELEAFERLLPFALTGAQRRAVREAAADMTSGRPMNRLVQGDVGSGKTAVAAACAWLAFRAGWQCAMMAPTEILAEQHARSLSVLLAPAGMTVGLLTGSMRAAEKRAVYAALGSGALSFVVGTHALLSEGVTFQRLGLVITDEQHRFGVRQRETLSQKGELPHTIVMSATPIPRTLAVILYGDLDISVINEMPANRLPIKNCVVNTGFRKKAYEFIRKEVEAGHQAYVICPMVEESEAIDAENVIAYTEALRGELPLSFSIEYLHGKMKPREKNEIMERFLANEIQVLVSTTVIEVGVNVPNATVMLIENSERFGLAQLHQLRGRVGRGDAQSYCIFMHTNDGKQIRERLDILCKSNDGFEIANRDMQLRGPGDLFGVRQSGLLDFALADIYTDADTLQQANEAVGTLLKEDPKLLAPGHQALKKKYERLLLRQNGQISL